MTENGEHNGSLQRKKRGSRLAGCGISLGAFLTIYSIDLYGLTFADELRGFLTGQLRALV